jgi:hypothetical protein
MSTVKLPGEVEQNNLPPNVDNQFDLELLW